MIKLDPRLAACAELVSGDVVIDVGTDHGYLPCFLVESKRCSRAYACDIAEGPLSSARACISREGLEDSITAVLSDGLLSLSDGAAASASDIVIAGMGGELIAEIISKGAKAGKLQKSARLILEPNTKAAFLRRFLCENGYSIRSEKAVRDGRFIYAVICAEFSGETRTLDELSAVVGGLDVSEPTAREYLEKEAERLCAAADGMSASASDASKEQAARLFELAEGIRRILNT